MSMTFGQRLRAWRTSKGISTWAVEKQTGVPRANLSSIEKGRRHASDDVLRRLSLMPGLDITYACLKGWRLADANTPEELMEALRTHFPEKEALESFLQEALRSEVPCSVSIPTIPVGGDDE